MRTNGELNLDGAVMNKIPVRYDPVGFKRLFVPSFSMTIVALIILSISSYSLSLFGKLDLLSISVSMTAVIFIYAMVHWLTSHSWFSTREMRELNKVLIDLFKGLSWPQMILLSISAGIGEELLFRGLLQTWLVSHVSPLWGIAAASLVFGLLHYINASYVLLTFFLGCIFGIAYHLTDSLLLVMAAHTFYDIIAFGVIVKYPHLLKTEPPNSGFSA